MRALDFLNRAKLLLQCNRYRACVPCAANDARKLDLFSEYCGAGASAIPAQRLIAAAYENVPMEIFGQEPVFRAASSFIVQASIRLPTTNRPLARTSRHFIVGVPSGNEITPCAADNSAVARRCDSVGATSAPASARNSSTDVTKI